MRKILTAAMAAITLGGAVAATASPAEARGHGGYHGGYGGYGGRYYRHDNGGAAIAAGVVGLALGAALANGGHGYSYGYGPSYYGRDYYGPPAYGYGYGEGYRVCESERWVWDPYWRRNVPVRTRYAC
jgi:hypothetical protein